MEHKTFFAAWRDRVTTDQPVVNLFGGEVFDQPIPSHLIPNRDTGWGVRATTGRWAIINSDCGIAHVEERPLMTEGEATQVWQRLELLVDPDLFHHTYRLVNVHD